MTQVDTVTTEVIRNAFISIASQMNNNLARSAYTPIIYEMKDCSVGLFNQNAELLGQAPGLPIFLGSLEAAINATTEHFGGPEIYKPGDVYAVNDSYLVGSHLNDVSVFSPIFHEGDLVGFGATKAHWMDIGAKDPSQTNDATSIYEEGYRLGPTHLYREGRPETGVLQFITRNSRLPRSIWGDLHAQIAACRTGERQLGELMDRFGRPVVEEAAAVVFEQCERLDREVVGSGVTGFEVLRPGVLRPMAGDPKDLAGQRVVKVSRISSSDMPIARSRIVTGIFRRLSTLRYNRSLWSNPNSSQDPYSGLIRA